MSAKIQILKILTEGRYSIPKIIEIIGTARSRMTNAEIIPHILNITKPPV
jgi:hypothetical protein